MSQSTKMEICDFLEKIPLAKVNRKIITLVKDNEMLRMLNPTVMKQGLKSPKRQVYLDVLLKVLKG